MEQHTPRPNGMAIASMILGIIALPTTCCIGFGLPIATIGVIFALLSRRGGKMTAQAAVGFGISLGCIILSIVSAAMSLLLIVSSPKFPETWDTVYNMELEDFSDYLLEELPNQLNDMLNDFSPYNNGASPDSDTPIAMDPFSNEL